MSPDGEFYQSSTTNIDVLAMIREQVPGRCGGRPVFPGTRIQPRDVLAQAKFGHDAYRIQKDYPSLTIEQIQDCIRRRA